MTDRDISIIAELNKKADLNGENACPDCLENERKFQKTKDLINAISRAQSQFIANVETRVLFGELLGTLLTLTESEYGFIGEVFYDANGAPYLKEHAITNIAWDDATRALLEEHSKTGLEFRKLNTLYGAVLTSGKPLISNNPSKDTKSHGIPEGHPPLNAFLGIPFYNNGKLAGMVGLANRPGGYDEVLVNYLDPLLSTCASLIEAHNIDRLKGRAETSLKRSQSSLEYAQHMAKLGHWELDLVSDRLYWSKEIYNIFEISPEEFEASYEAFLSAVHPDDRALVDNAYMESVKSGRPYEITHRLLLKNDAVKHVIEKGFTEYAPDGRPVRSVGTVQDITERRKMDEEILKIEKLESLGVLAGGIAHDFNNVLTGIIGNIYFARESRDKDRREQALNEAEKAAMHAKELTGQLLTFARGGAPVKKTAVVNEIVRTSAEFILRGSNVRCEFSFADGLKTAAVDPGQISQVIGNIILNAKQAMPGGGVVKVSAGNVDAAGTNKRLSLKDGAYVRISIEDNGPGIPDEIRHKVFDPYFTTKSGGNGLGLASVYSIITRHNGHVSFDSTPGVGTVFHIYLPASNEAVEGSKAGSLGPDEALARGHGRLLVMDDEEMIRDIAMEILETSGYEAHSAPSGEEAIKMYQKAFAAGSPFDVVIMDLTIPGGMGGKEAIQRLKEIDPAIKAIVSSGYSDDPIMAEYERYGFIGVVVKPYRVQELCEAVSKAINARHRKCP
ncbi:MAG: response regulator [Deltaproteobacteria bacterium]|nr:response regulator [Deltaproteobacteria bacterium]